MDNKFKVQSVVLPKDKFTLSEAKKKVMDLGYKVKYLGKDVNEYKAGQTINFWRFRQNGNSQSRNKNGRKNK